MSGAGDSRAVDLAKRKLPGEKHHLQQSLDELLCGWVLFLCFAQQFTVCKALRFVLDLPRERQVQPDLSISFYRPESLGTEKLDSD